MSRTRIRRTLPATSIALALAVAVACSGVRDTAEDATPSPVAASSTRVPPATAAATATADDSAKASPSSTADAPATPTPRAASPTATATPPTPGDDGVPRVPPLRALTFSPGEEFTSADIVARGVGDAGRGAFNGAALVIPSVGVDAQIETQVVGTNGDMPEPSSMQMIAWYDFSLWPGLGGVPLGGGNTVLAGNLGGVFAQLGAVQRGEILVVHLTDGRRLFYHVEFNKITPRDSAIWQDIVSATADESMTLITAAGTGSGQHWSHRRIVWARRVNCALREAPETPTRAPYVECELPQ